MAEMNIVAGKEAERYYPYSSMFYANRHSFWEAGQNSWALPPAQDQDAFLQLTNVEPVLQGVMQRRRGYVPFVHVTPPSTPTLGTAMSHSYSFRSDALGIRRVVWSPVNFFGEGGPEATDEQGNITNDPIYFTPTNAIFAPRMVLSRDYGYFSDGSQGGLVKWDGTTSTTAVTLWGTDISQVNAFTVGPSYAGTGSQQTLGAGAINWANVAGVVGPPDSNYASISLNSAQISNYLVGTNYGLNFTGATGPITGVQVSVNGLQTAAGSNASGFQGSIGLNLNGTRVGTQKNLSLPLGAAGTVSLGAPNDLWGTVLQYTDASNATFGVDIWYENFLTTPEGASIDSIQVTIFTAGGAIAFTVNTATTNVVLLNGRTYFFAFQNSSTLTTSDLSTPSVSTGPLTGNQINLTNIGVSTDPQVDTVLIFATADGNDETTLYLLGTVPNGTTTFTDTIPDELSASYVAGATLLTNALYQDTDAFGNLHGVADNQPPPAGLNYMVKHKGRIYGAVGRALWFSKNLDDVTTANGLITSKWEEAWPTTNQFDISDQAETIQGLLSDGETLWIGTERAIRRLIGDSPSNFQIPEIQFNEVGLYNQDCWQICFFEGQPVGAVWLTPDFKVMASDFNTYTDIGGPIQDLLNTIVAIPNPGIAPPSGQSPLPLVQASYVSRGPADYYMLYLPTQASNFNANIVCVYDLRKKKWFIWHPTDNISTSLFLIDQFGQPRWLFAEPSGLTYEWSYGTFTDRLGSVTSLAPPTNYTVTIQTTWQDMGDYGLRKYVNQIIPTTADNTALTVMVEAASNEQDFNAPLLVVPATTVTPAAIPDDVFVPLASGPSHSRAFRFTFVSPPSTIQNILTGFSIEAGVFHRY